MVNTFADLLSEKLKNTGPFKMLVSGDTIRAEKKFHQAFSFSNYAKLIFSCNDIPKSDDRGYAYFKRWIIFHFEHAFIGEDRDNYLIDKITTSEEMSGLLNLALISLRQLIEDNGFVDTDDIETVEEEYSLNSSTVKRFLIEKCEITNEREHFIICRDLWGVYLKYCKDSKISSSYDNVFGMELAELGLKKERLRVNKTDREYCYVGIKLRENVT